MELVTYRFTLDTNKSGVQRILQGIETGDNMSRQIRISLANGKETYELPQNGITAAMYVSAPSASTPSVNTCVIDGNEIVYNILSSDISEAGSVEMQLKVIGATRDGATEVLVSPRFELEVWESLVSDSSAQASATYTALENALAQAQSAYNSRVVSVVLDDDNMFIVTFADGSTYESTAIQDALAVISDIEEYVESAHEAAEQAEAAITVVDAAKDTAVSASTSAQNYASSASSSATSASTSASNASVSESNALTYKNAAYASEQNAQTYADNASASATNASNYATSAQTYASNASTSATNAASSATQASGYVAQTEAEKLASEGYALGTQNGVDVDPSSPYYENNAKYYSDRAGGTALSGLTDVGITNPTDKQALVYDATLSKWVNGDSTPPIAEAIEYDNTVKGVLEADNVQDAIDELTEQSANIITITKSEFDDLDEQTIADNDYCITDADSISASNIPYDDTQTSLGSDVQTAIDALNTKISSKVSVIDISQSDYNQLSEATKKANIYAINDAEDMTASTLPYDDTDTGLGDDVQTAIDTLSDNLTSLIKFKSVTATSSSNGNVTLGLNSNEVLCLGAKSSTVASNAMLTVGGDNNWLAHVVNSNAPATVIANTSMTVVVAYVDMNA